MGTTEKLAGLIVSTGYDSMSPEVIHVAKRTIIDTLGVQIAGSQEEAGKKIAAFVQGMGCKPRSLVVGAGFRTSPPDAALANGTSGHVLDFDDVHPMGSGHPSVTLVPAILAVAEDLKLSGRDVIEAFVIGFEAWCRIPASGIDLRSLGFHPTAIMGTMAAAVSVAKLLKLNEGKVMMVLGLAASHAAGFGRNRGTMTKSFHAGNAARSGVVSGMLVRDGWTATPDLLEGKFGFVHAFAGKGKVDDSRITVNFANPFSLISPVPSVKKYPACHLTHRCIDATLALAKQYHVSAEDVAEVECLTGTQQADVLKYTEPKNYLQAKFSMQYTVAAALKEGKVGFAELSDEKVNNPEMKKLMKRVKLTCGGDEYLARVETVKMRLKNGQEHSLSLEYARGDGPEPLSDEEIIAKYRDCAQVVLPKDSVEKSLELLLDLEKVKDINQLMNAISESRK